MFLSLLSSVNRLFFLTIQQILGLTSQLSDSLSEYITSKKKTPPTKVGDVFFFFHKSLFTRIVL